MRLRIRAFGLALGTVIGLGFFLAILYSTFFGQGGTFDQIRPLFGPWAGRNILGAFLGLVWGFAYGFIGGALMAWFYNQFCKALYKTEATK